MNGKLWRVAARLLPVRFLSAQQSRPKPLKPRAARRIARQRQRLRDHANAINDLAGHIQSLDDARKLARLVAAEFSHGLRPRWSARSMRNRIARAEFESAADPGSLIPEQHVADGWNGYLARIGAPQEHYVNAAEIHTLRDTCYVSSQLSWARGNQSIWAVPNIYAVGRDGKVANGCRALEVLRILWQLRNQPELLGSIRELIKKDELWSDMYKNPTKPPSPGSQKCTVTVRQGPPNPIRQAALQYTRDHGVRAMKSATEGLLKGLFAG